MRNVFRFDFSRFLTRDAVLSGLERVLEYGLYLSIFTLFRASTLRFAVTGVLIGAVLLHGILTRGERIDFLSQRVLWVAGAFLVLVLGSVLYSSDVGAAFYEYTQGLGYVALLAVLVPYVIREKATLQRLLWAALFTALYLNFIQIKGIVNEYRQVGELLKDVSLHRSHSVSLMFFLPFVLAWTLMASGWRARLGWGAVALQGVLLAATAGRAALLSACVGFIVWLWLKFDKRIVIAVACIGVVVLVSVALLPRGTFVHAYLKKGFSTADRVELTWGPTIAMIAQAPITGYGYGSFVYPQQFEREVDKSGIPESNWNWVKQLGPHNYYLEVWFNSGITALLAMMLLFACYFTQQVAVVSRSADRLTGYAALAGLAAFTQIYLVHAHFGPTALRPLGVLLGLGIAVALMHARRGRASPRFRLSSPTP